MLVDSIARRLVAIVGAVFAVLLTLNLERFAAEQGWDLLLVGLIGDAPGPLLQTLTAPWVGTLALAVVAFALGFWADWWLYRRSERTSKSALCLVELGIKLSDIADSLNRALTYGASPDLLAEINALAISLKKQGFATLSTPPRGDDLERLTRWDRYARTVGSLLVNEHFAEARKAAEDAANELDDKP